MDSKMFDALTRGFGAQRSRRAALKSLAAGLMGLGVAKSASAQVGIERATCGQSCSSSTDCNAGLRCSRPNNRDGICVAIADSRDTCNRNINCERDYELCRNDRCVNQSTCNRCHVTADCPTGEVCRNGNCGGCDRDGQCPSGEVCRNGRCERDRDSCRSDRDCRKRERCRRNRCVRRD
jgi:Cys-rich repeat protein